MNTPRVSQRSAGRPLFPFLSAAAVVLGLLLPASSLFAQTSVSNIASAQPPAGVNNTNAAADPTGKVTATDTNTVSPSPKLTVSKAVSKIGRAHV